PPGSLPSPFGKRAFLARRYWLHPLLCHTAYLYRVSRAGCLSLWTAEHRRRRTIVCSCFCDRLGRNHLRQSFCLDLSSALLCVGNPGRRSLGRNTRRVEGAFWFA